MFFFSFKTTEVALMMDWEDSSGSSGSEEEQEESWNISQADCIVNITTCRASFGHVGELFNWLAREPRKGCVKSGKNSTKNDTRGRSLQDTSVRAPTEAQRVEDDTFE